MAQDTAVPFVRRRPARAGDPVTAAGSELDGPGSTRVSCLLTQDVIAADAPAVALWSSGSIVGLVALFSNPYLNGQEEALVCSQGGLTYLRRADTGTGWAQSPVTRSDRAGDDAADPIQALEVVVVVHPRDRSVWAIVADSRGSVLGLRLVAEVKDGVTTCRWQLVTNSIVQNPAQPVLTGTVNKLSVTYDSRDPCVSGLGSNAYAEGVLVVITRLMSGPSWFRIDSVKLPFYNIDELTARRPRQPTTTASYIMPTFYMRSGDKLAWYDMASKELRTIPNTGMREIVGAFPSGGGIGCLYLDTAGNLAAVYPSGANERHFITNTTSGLGFTTAEAWLDVNEMVHVYGVDADHTLKVLHQASWGVSVGFGGSFPVWSQSTGVKPPSPTPVSVVTCVGLVPGVTAFALDPFPDEYPSQLVKTGDSVAGTDQYGFYTQDINSARWSRDLVRLVSTAPPKLVTSYVSTVSVLDRRGTPMTGLTVRVSAESLAEVRVDGASYLVGPGYSAAVSTNLQGRVVISTPADGLAPAILHVDAAGLQNGAIVQPAAAIHSYLGGSGTLPSQKGRFDEKALRGANIVQPGREASIPAVVKGARQALALADGKIPAALLFAGAGPVPAIHGFAVGPRPGARPNARGVHVAEYSEFMTAEEFDAHQDAIRNLPNYAGTWQDFADWAGDVWQGIKDGAIEVYDVAVNVVKGIAQIAIKIADAVVHLIDLVLDSADTAVRAVESLFRQVVTDVGKVVDWLKSVFAFKDIWETKTALTVGTGTVLGYGVATVEHFENVTANWFVRQEAAIKGYYQQVRKDYNGRPLGTARNQLPAMTDASGTVLAPGAIREDPRGSWLMQQALSTATLAAAARFEADEETPAAIGAIAEAWDDFLAAIRKEGLVDQAVNAFNDLDALVAGIADPADPAGAPKASVVAVIDAMEKLTLMGLQALDLIMGAVVTFVRSVNAGLTELLTYPLTGFAPLNDLYRWVQTQAEVKDDQIEDLTVGGLAFLLAAFPATTGYKLLNGVDDGPFPHGTFPTLNAPQWHSAYDPDRVVGDPRKENDDLRIVQMACGAAGLAGTISGAVADCLPLMTVDKKIAWWIDLTTGITSTALGSLMFGAVASCPPVTGTAWGAADGKWAVAFELAVINVFASLAAIAAAIRDRATGPDTSVLRNIKEAIWGPVLSTFLGMGYLIPSGMACMDEENKTNPYTTAMILLSGISNATQIGRIGLKPGRTPDTIRGGVIAAVNIAANGVSASMLTAAASMAYAEIDAAQTLPGGRVRQPYSAQIKASGGDHVFNRPLKDWTVVAGRLPNGLLLDKVTGRITGTPTAASTASFNVQCTDSYGPPQYSAPTPLSIEIKA